MNKLTVILFASMIALLSCTPRQHPSQNIFLFKNGDGLYQYNCLAHKENLIFKAGHAFINETYQLTNDTLTFGLSGEQHYKVKENYSDGETYYVDYYSVALSTGKSWLSKKINYEVNNHSNLHIKTAFFDTSGTTNTEKDTDLIYRGSSTSGGNVTYNEFSPRFFSKSTLGDKTVFSRRGDLYLAVKSDTHLLVKFDGTFDPKFGSGYYQPRIDPSGKYIIFRYLPGFVNFLERPSLMKLDLTTNEIRVLRKGVFANPRFSSDGNFLLFSRNEKYSKNRIWISDICIMDMNTLKLRKIGKANSAHWVK